MGGCTQGGQGGTQYIVYSMVQGQYIRVRPGLYNEARLIILLRRHFGRGALNPKELVNMVTLVLSAKTCSADPKNSQNKAKVSTDSI